MVCIFSPCSVIPALTQIQGDWRGLNPSEASLGFNPAYSSSIHLHSSTTEPDFNRTEDET
jgi:hypothetical protein